MSKLSKAQYEERANSARISGNNNAETLKFHEVNEDFIATMSKITETRHLLHKNLEDNAMTWFLGEDQKVSNWVDLLQNWAGVNYLDESTVMDIDWQHDLIDKGDYLDEDGEPSYWLFVQECTQDIAKQITKINSAVEDKMSDIDKEYGTQYQPTGSLRILN